MDNAKRAELWDELRLLQPIIDKFDDFTFKIKSWFITTIVAITGIAIGKEPAFLWLNFLVALIFYSFEVTYRAAHAAFLEWGREIQRILRGESGPEDSEIGPQLDKHLYSNGRELRQSKIHRFFRIFGLPEKLAHDDTEATKAILREMKQMIFQIRVSLVYLASVVATVIVAPFLKQWWIVFLFFILVIGLRVIYIRQRSHFIEDNWKGGIKEGLKWGSALGSLAQF